MGPPPTAAEEGQLPPHSEPGQSQSGGESGGGESSGVESERARFQAAQQRVAGGGQQGNQG